MVVVLSYPSMADRGSLLWIQRSQCCPFVAIMSCAEPASRLWNSRHSHQTYFSPPRYQSPALASHAAILSFFTTLDSSVQRSSRLCLDCFNGKQWQRHAVHAFETLRRSDTPFSQRYSRWQELIGKPWLSMWKWEIGGRGEDVLWARFYFLFFLHHV